jgi:ligand-binding sensor domain-containing protein
LYQPHSIAIDGLGNAWTANYEGVSKFSSAGTPLSPSIGYTGGGLANNPSSIAIDGSGNAWIANPYGNIVSELSNAGTPLSPSTGYTGGGLTGPNSIAIDVSGDVWLSSNSDIVSEIIGVATPVITPICAGLPATPTANGTSNLGTRP